jgi:hypothetical protein
MDERNRTLGLLDMTQLAIAATALAIITLTTHIIVAMIELPSWGMDFPVSGWPWILPPAAAIVILYPVFISKSEFRRPISLRIIMDQSLFGVVIFPTMTLIAQLCVVFFAQFAGPATKIPVIGPVLRTWGALAPPSLYLVILWKTTILAVILGVFSALPLYYLVEKGRARELY